MFVYSKVVTPISQLDIFCVTRNDPRVLEEVGHAGDLQLNHLAHVRQTLIWPAESEFCVVASLPLYLEQSDGQTLTK
jgi:hypothetical protein